MDRNGGRALRSNSVLSFGCQKAPKSRLLCFPYAGGCAQAFRSWAEALPREIEICGVQLPGRWNRRSDPAPGTIAELVEDLTERLRGHLDLPYAILGYSLGALVAYEFARALRKRGFPLPKRLVVAAAVPPQLPILERPISGAGDEEFLSRIATLGVLSDAALGSEIVRKLLLPVLRDDVRLVENYVYREDRPLEIPITAMAGLWDPLAGPATMDAWSVHTSSEFELVKLDGSHSFIHTAEAALLRALRERVLPLDSADLAANVRMA